MEKIYWSPLPSRTDIFILEPHSTCSRSHTWNLAQNCRIVVQQVECGHLLYFPMISLIFQWLRYSANFSLRIESRTIFIPYSSSPKQQTASWSCLKAYIGLGSSTQVVIDGKQDETSLMQATADERTLDLLAEPLEWCYCNELYIQLLRGLARSPKPCWKSH